MIKEETRNVSLFLSTNSLTLSSNSQYDMDNPLEDAIDHDEIIVSAIFFLKCYSSLGKKDINLYLANGNELEFVDRGTPCNGGVLFNVSKDLFTKKHLGRSFVIENINTGNSPEIIIYKTGHTLDIKYHPFESVYKTKNSVSDTVNSSLSFFNDCITGDFVIKKTIYGGLLPYNVQLSYSEQRNTGEYMFFPKGWKLNLLDELIYSMDNNNDIATLTLIDGDNLEHVFAKASGSNVHFYSKDGTGLIVYDQPTINPELTHHLSLRSDLLTSNKMFLTNGKLLRINKDNGEYIMVSYGTNLITLTDFRGNVITCSNDEINNQISIKLNNSFEYVLKKDTNGFLTQIQFNNKTENITNLSGQFSSYSTCDGYSLSVNRDVNQISSILISRFGNTIKSYSFVQDYLKTFITDRHGITTYSIVDENLVPISTGELFDDDFSPIVIRSEKMLVSDVSSSVLNQKGKVFYKIENQEAITDFIVSSNNDNQGTVNITLSSNLDKSANPYYLTQNKKYILLARLARTYTMSMNETRQVKLELLNGATVVVELTFNQLDSKQIVAIPFVSPITENTNSQLQIRLTYIGLKTLGSVAISDISIIEQEGKRITYYASNINVNNIQGLTGPFSFDELSWYEFTNAQDLNTDGSVNAIYSYSDLVRNYFNVELNKHFIWSDDSHKLTYNPSNSNNSESGGYILRKRRVISTNNTIFGKKTLIKEYLENGVRKEIYEFSYITRNGNNFDLITIKNVGDESQRTVETFNNKFVLLEKITSNSEDSDFDITKYKYLVRSNVQTKLLASVEQTTDNSTDSFFNEYSYDSSNRIIEESVTSKSSQESISYSYLSYYDLVDTITDQLSNEETYSYSSFLDYKTNVTKDDVEINKVFISDTILQTSSNDNEFQISSFVSNSNEITTFEIKETSQNQYTIVHRHERELSANGDSIYKHGIESLDKVEYSYDKYDRIFSIGDYGELTINYQTIYTYIKRAYFIYLNKENDNIRDCFNITDIIQYINEHSPEASSIAKLYKIVSLSDSTFIDYSYNNDGLLSEQLIRDINENDVLTASYIYDVLNRLTETQYEYFNVSRNILLEYSNIFSDQISSIRHDISSSSYVEQDIEYDSLHRLKYVSSSKMVNALNGHAYRYSYSSITSSATDTGNNITSYLITQVDYWDILNYSPNDLPLESFEIQYDLKNNITSINLKVLKPIGWVNVPQHAFTYDSNNRLTSELNKGLGLLITYSYDDNGNITQVVKAPTSGNGTTTTNTYVYDTYYKDKLISFNGTTITYDSSFNPIGYGNKTFSWNNDHQLKSILIGNDLISFTYNYDGVRTKKVSSISGIHYYILDGHRIIGEKIVNGNNVETLSYLYGVDGVFGIVRNGAYFYLKKNIFGDVTHIYNSSGIVAKYSYDAYGNHVVTDASGNSISNNPTHIGNLNPFRYRGYYYDTDTGLYYCVSRYYVPEWCRWLSIDNDKYFDSNKIFGTNLFAYCKNSPIMYVDPEGVLAISTTLICLIIGAIVGAAVGGYLTYNYEKEQGKEGDELITLTILGIIGGAIIGAIIGYIAAPYVIASTGFLGYSLTADNIYTINSMTILGNNPDYLKAAKTLGAGAFEFPLNFAPESIIWSNNVQYISDAYKLGSQFEIVATRVLDNSRWLWKEIQYLMENNIPWEML